MSEPTVRNDRCVFRQTFKDSRYVSDSGGIVTTCNVDDAIVPTTPASGVTYYGTESKLVNATQATIRLRFKVGAVVPTNKYLLCKGPISFTDNQWFVLFATGQLSWYIASSASDVSNYLLATNAVVANTEYVCHLVFDGTQSTAANRGRLYVNGVLVASSIGGTLPTRMRASSSPVTLFQTYGGTTHAPDADFKFFDCAVWDTALTPTEVSDDAQRCAFADQDDSFVPSTLSGCQLWCEGDTTRYVSAITAATSSLADGDMEAVGVASWLASGVGVRAKSTTNPYSGTQCLQLTDDGVNNYAWVYQTVLTTGNSYRLRARARGDGSAMPRIHDSSVYIWVGSTSTSWQDVDVTFTSGGTQMRLYGTGLVVGAGNHVEWDDVVLTPLNASQFTDLSNSGHHLLQATLASQPLIVESGQGRLLRFDGTADTMKALFALVQPCTMYIMAKWTINAGLRYLNSGGSATTTIYHVGTSTATLFAGSDGPARTFTSDTWYIWEAVYNGASSKIAVNGGTQTTGNAGANDPGGFTLCAYASATGGWSNADVAAAVVYSGTQSEIDRQRVVRYLRGVANRLGIVL